MGGGWVGGGRVRVCTGKHIGGPPIWLQDNGGKKKKKTIAPQTQWSVGGHDKRWGPLGSCPYNGANYINSLDH